MDSSLLPFFAPNGVVVVGVSHDPTKLGYGLARNLAHSGYRGKIHFVNPKGGALLNRPVHLNLADVPDPVDLAVLVIAAPLVPEALRACAARGIRAIIIASGGFREVGPEGAALEAECVRLAREHDLRLIGPNCIGLLDTHLPLDTTFLPPPGPIPGDVAFLSHSGAVCEAVIDWANGQGFGLSRLVSLGNQADLTEADLLAPVAEDPYTRVLTLYLEGITHGARFVEQARAVTRLKPVIALKVGRFASGRKAVASHTGALAGQEAAYNAAFRRAGVIRADTSEEMFDWARALAWSPLPEGRAMAVLTNAGGPGAIAADALEANGLLSAELSESTAAALRALLPPAASVRNPVDMLASASPEQYAGSLTLLLADPNVHGVLVILPPPPMYTAEAVVSAMLPSIQAARKPVVFALMGEILIRRASEILRAARIPDYRFPERAASALAVLVQRAEALARPLSLPAALADVKPEAVRAVLARYADETWLNADDTAAVMEAYGIRIPRLALARTADEAAQLAESLGFPLALKVASPDIAHKSDVGGVLLNMMDAAQTRAGFETVTRNARAARPEAALLGVHLQLMLPAGQEVIVGAVRDPQFGPLLMFGSGGVEVEGLKDVAFALAPLASDEAAELLESTWAGRKLRGYRNLPPADRAAVIEVLLRLAQLAADFPQFSELEVNPLRVLPEGQGAVAVDVRLRVKAPLP
jgi:acetyl coenzyme A synthetase (ADP forming)-like protein